MNNLTKANRKTWAIFGIVTLIAVAAIAIFCVGNSFAVEGEATGSAATAEQIEGAAGSAVAPASEESAAPAEEEGAVPAERAADASERAADAADEEAADPDAEGDETVADKAANKDEAIQGSNQNLESDNDIPSDDDVSVWYKYDGRTLYLSGSAQTGYAETTDADPEWLSDSKETEKKACTNVICYNEISPNVTAKWFNEFSTLTTLNLNSLNTSNVTDMNLMFNSCSSLTSLDVSDFDTGKVTDMYGMFANCTSLTELNITNFDTTNVTNFACMFSTCASLRSIEISTFDKAGMTQALESGVNAYVYGMFQGCTNLITIKATDNFDLTDLFSKYTTTFTSTDMFKDCNNLVGGAGTKYDGNHVDAYYARIDSASTPGYFTGEPVGDLFYKFDTDNTLHISNTNLGAGYKATTAEEHAWQEGSEHSVCTTVVFDNEISPTTTKSWFNNFSNLKTFKNLASLNTSNVIDMESMFDRCSSLGSIDLSSFNTANVTDMSQMFKDCTALESINLSSFNTSNVTDMTQMFENCEVLGSVDLSSFNTSKVTSMGLMFSGWKSITSIDLSSFNTSNVNDMYGMFEYCDALTSINLASFDTRKVVNFNAMFGDCYALTNIDISAFDTSGLIKCVQEGEEANIRQMFEDCENLITIYASDKFDISSLILKESEFFNSENMFKGCTKLVGGAGTTYDASVYDETSSNDPYTINDAKYARVDGGSANPGYFTPVPSPVPPTPVPGEDTTSAATTGSTGDSIPFALLAAFAVVAAVAAGAVVYARKRSK